MKRKNAIKNIIFLAATITTAIAINGAITETHASASPVDDDLNNLYQQLVVEGKNEAYIYPTSGLTTKELYDKLLQIDNPNTLYDGVSLRLRGVPYLSTRSDGRSGIVFSTDYTIEGADKFTDSVVEILNEELGENATDREKMYAIFDFIANNYQYSNEEKEEIEAVNASVLAGTYHEDYNKDYQLTLNSFIKAYGADNNEMTCSNFAELTYLLANKMGIDCKAVYSNNHAFNIVKLDDDPNYIMCDLTAGKYGLVDKKSAESAKDGTYIADSNIAAITPTYAPASRFENFREFYYLLFHGYNPGGWEEWSHYFITPLIQTVIAILVTAYTISIIKALISRAKKKRAGRTPLKTQSGTNTR